MTEFPPLRSAALSRGRVVLARDGASREQLAAIVEIAMTAWLCPAERQ
jgi:hypothetical protein